MQQLESEDYSKIRIQRSDNQEKRDDRRDKNKRRKRVDSDDDSKQPKNRKLTKHEEKLRMEQIKENLRAKSQKGYVPKDVYAEDEKRRKMVKPLSSI